MKIKNVLIGSDPELFIWDKDLDTPYPSVGLIGGTKSEPKDIGSGCAIQEDNVLAEFCIPPTKDVNDFIASINYSKSFIEALLPKTLGIKIKASAYFHKNYLKSEQAMIFGCDPDFCAWTENINEKPESNTTLRTSGGHIHVGYDNPNMDTNLEIIKTMDLFLGIPSIIMDTDTERRKLYGKAGAFRPKHYGLEYRTLSGFWIENDELMHWAFNNTLSAIDFINSGKSIDEKDKKSIQKCINNSDVDLAKNILNDYNIKIKEIECVE